MLYSLRGVPLTYTNALQKFRSLTRTCSCPSLDSCLGQNCVSELDLVGRGAMYAFKWVRSRAKPEQGNRKRWSGSGDRRMFFWLMWKNENEEPDSKLSHLRENSQQNVGKGKEADNYESWWKVRMAQAEIETNWQGRILNYESGLRQFTSMVWESL